MNEVDLREYIPLIVLALIGIVSSLKKKKNNNKELQQEVDNESVVPNMREVIPYEEIVPDIQMPQSPWSFEKTSRANEILDRYEPGDEGVAMTKSAGAALSLSPESIEFKSLSIEEYLKQESSKDGAEVQYNYDDYKNNKGETFEFDPKMAFVYSEIMKPKF